jgi:hypothetical protein
MARINDHAQWIVLMGLIVSISLIFLAIIINESALVGQTTSENILDFPKADIKDVRSEILEWDEYNLMETPPADLTRTDIQQDIRELTLARKNAVVEFSNPTGEVLTIHYNNGVTKYDETIQVK